VKLWEGMRRQFTVTFLRWEERRRVRRVVCTSEEEAMQGNTNHELLDSDGVSLNGASTDIIMLKPQDHMMGH
jgi:hypothetical protein